MFIGDYFEAELGSGTAFPVFVPELDNVGLPHKFYLPIIRNGEGTATPQPVNPGNGFYFTHPIRPNHVSNGGKSTENIGIKSPLNII